MTSKFCSSSERRTRGEGRGQNAWFWRPQAARRPSSEAACRLSASLAPARAPCLPPPLSQSVGGVLIEIIDEKDETGRVNGSDYQYHLEVRTRESRDLCLERAGIYSHFLPVSSFSSILSMRTSRTTLSTDWLISHRPIYELGGWTGYTSECSQERTERSPYGAAWRFRAALYLANHRPTWSGVHPRRSATMLTLSGVGICPCISSYNFTNAAYSKNACGILAWCYRWQWRCWRWQQRR